MRHEGEDGLLWVADSINSNADFGYLSKKMKMRIKSAKAYSAIHDENSQFPNLNFLDVVEKELNEGSFKALVIGGGSIDISNLDTKNNPDENISNFREKVINSAHAIFTIAETALVHFPSLKNVIVLKRAPRFDPIETDPLNLKPQLSALADSVSFGLWCDSKFKNKIILGGQDIPNGENEHTNVFGSTGTLSYDGLHMKGPSGRLFFTRSIQKVLIKANLIDKNTELYTPPSQPFMDLPKGRMQGSEQNERMNYQGSQAGSFQKIPPSQSFMEFPNGRMQGSEQNERRNYHGSQAGRIIPDGLKKPVTLQGHLNKGYKNVPQGRKTTYSPMKHFRDRISSMTAENKLRNSGNNINSDDVFIQPARIKKTYSTIPSNQSENHPARPSVIKINQQEPLNLQQHYNIPVFNPFTDLLN